MERTRRQWRGVVCILVALTTATTIQALTPPFSGTAFVTSASRHFSRKRSGLGVVLQELQWQHPEEIASVPSFWKKAWDRLDTLESAGLKQQHGDGDSSPLLMRGPGLKRALLWLGVAFLWKWYRARFINKIPVWDRQPQWNMVITSREQEKELKAYTCKNCGSTLFIAKNREWFFQGDTGIGGLGCYTCGAKGKDNFVMDRDRILEDVGDDDDYFDYERPLDFVTAAERRALLKQAQGDEDVANQMLIDSTKEGDGQDEASAEEVLDAEIIADSETITDEITSSVDATEEETVDEVPPEVVEPEIEATVPEPTKTDDTPSTVESEPKLETPEVETKTSEPASKAAKKEIEELSLDDLDALGLDDF